MTKKKVREEDLGENSQEDTPIITSSFLDELYSLKAKLEELKITRMSDLDNYIERELKK